MNNDAHIGEQHCSWTCAKMFINVSIKTHRLKPIFFLIIVLKVNLTNIKSSIREKNCNIFVVNRKCPASNG